MGEIFRRKVRVCTACDLRLDTTAARRRCEAAGHPIDVRQQGIWWIKYRVDGTLRCETSGSADHTVAETLLRQREGNRVPSIASTPVNSAPAAPAEPAPEAGTLSVAFADAAQDLLNDYAMNRRRSLRTLKIRVEKHLRPAFGRDAISDPPDPLLSHIDQMACRLASTARRRRVEPEIARCAHPHLPPKDLSHCGRLLPTVAHLVRWHTHPSLL